MRWLPIIALILSGCASCPEVYRQAQDSCMRHRAEDSMLVEWWGRELVNGELTYDEYKFLVQGRLEARP
jgi:hypothetical protein